MPRQPWRRADRSGYDPTGFKHSRKKRFEILDKPYAKLLPVTFFPVTQIKTDVRVTPNYHIDFDKHFYSVPYELVRKHVGGSLPD